MDEKEMIEKGEVQAKLELIKREVIIVAPHCDDEIIGCFEILMNRDISPIIIYTEDANNDRRQEALNLKKFVPHIKAQFFNKEVPENLLKRDSIVYVPDHTHEFHPEHRRVGYRGEELWRRGVNVVFYSIQMNAPYIHEVKEFKEKRRLLEKTYPSQKSLFNSDHKYFLFEGRCQFLR